MPPKRLACFILALIAIAITFATPDAILRVDANAADQDKIKLILQCGCYPPPDTSGTVELDNSTGLVTFSGMPPTTEFGKIIKGIVDSAGAEVRLVEEHTRLYDFGGFDTNARPRRNGKGNGRQFIDLVDICKIPKDGPRLFNQQQILIHEIVEGWVGKTQCLPYHAAHDSAIAAENRVLKDRTGECWERVTGRVSSEDTLRFIYQKKGTNERRAYEHTYDEGGNIKGQDERVSLNFKRQHYVNGCPETGICSFDLGDAGVVLANVPGSGVVLDSEYLEVDHRGYLYASLPFEGMVVRVDRTGVIDQVFQDVTNLSFPYDMALNPLSGELYIGDNDLDHIAVFDDSTGAFLRTFSHPCLSMPVGLDLDERGHVWVASHGGDCVVEFDSAGVFVDSTSHPSLVGLAGLVVADVDTVTYVVSNTTNQILILGPDGDYIGVFASGPELNSPWGIDVEGGKIDLTKKPGYTQDPVTHIVVANPGTPSVIRYEPDGSVANIFTEPGLSPVDVATSARSDFAPWPTGIGDVPRRVAIDMINYPNPFNPVTKIEFSLPHSVDVTLTIYDVAGRMVRTLINNRRPPGRQRVIWDGRNDDGAAAASGIYFARLVSDRQQVTRKLVLLK